MTITTSQQSDNLMSWRGVHDCHCPRPRHQKQYAVIDEEELFIFACLFIMTP